MAKQPAVFWNDVHWDFVAFRFHPFVKTRRRRDASSGCQDSFEGWLFREGLRAGVDHFIPDRFILCPGGNKAPPHEAEVLGFIPAHDGHDLCRGDVVAGLVKEKVIPAHDELVQVEADFQFTELFEF